MKKSILVVSLVSILTSISAEAAQIRVTQVDVYNAGASVPNITDTTIGAYPAGSGSMCGPDCGLIDSAGSGSGLLRLAALAGRRIPACHLV